MHKMQIFVLTRDGKKSIYEAERFATVGELKARIGRQMCVPMGFSRLTYKGRMLSNDSILEDIGIKRLSTLELYWQPLVWSPKQYREKELHLEKLEEKERAGEQLDEDCETETEAEDEPSCDTVCEENEGGDLLNGSPDGRPTGSLQHLLQLSNGKLNEDLEDEEPVEEDISSISSDELEFLAAYRRCARSAQQSKQTDISNLIAEQHSSVCQCGPSSDVKEGDPAMEVAVDLPGAKTDVEISKETKLMPEAMKPKLSAEDEVDFKKLMERRVKALQDLKRYSAENLCLRQSLPRVTAMPPGFGAVCVSDPSFPTIKCSQSSSLSGSYHGAGSSTTQPLPGSAAGQGQQKLNPNKRMNNKKIKKNRKKK
ncbi:uncharacterized protein LOC115633278 [Scaptodrosophila lebanonensis]|uniref:Uncharacterized protein LOC115633278 n=1 Tax=Drosophila lebanonensis TaxID=7225 RepID=A0A6J2UDV5_DROLE|nr:uncharacterized protein LOC115633278 [Scaptodrosophila lebanonensis]